MSGLSVRGPDCRRESGLPQETWGGAQPPVPADFCPDLYLALNPDVWKHRRLGFSDTDAVLHWMHHGRVEGRSYK